MSYRIDSKNGNIYLIDSPDRELTPTLTVMVRVEVTTGRKGKSSYVVHPVAHDIGLRTESVSRAVSESNKKMLILAHNEARIMLKIIDQNDNAPRFVNESMPVIAAVSSYTAYGTPVATVQVSVLVRTADSRRSRFSMYVYFSSVGRRSGSGPQLGHQVRDGRRSRGKTVLQRGRVHRPYTHGRRVQSIDEQYGFRFRYTGDGQSRCGRRSISHYKRFR